MKRNAFSFIELLFVLLIMTLFFSLSLPFFAKFTKKANLDTATRSVASVLMTARTLAISNSTDYYAVCDNLTADPNEYFMSNGTSVVDEKYKLPAGVYFFKGDSDTSYPPADAIEFANQVTVDGTTYNTAVCFKPTGQLDDIEDRSLYLADGNISRTPTRCNRITVQSATGKATITKGVDIN